MVLLLIGVGAGNVLGRKRYFAKISTKFCPKNAYEANIHPTIFCSYWLYINSHKLKHEVTGNNLLILYAVYLICLL